jgi:large subunit ribosomal protein L6
MSRIGKAPITIPEKVKVTVALPTISVEGPKGALSLDLSDRVAVEVSESAIQVTAVGDHRKSRAMHGLTGVTDGFTKSLEIVGVGYRAEVDDKSLTLYVGYSKPVVMSFMDGVRVEVERNTIIHVRGADKQKVGEMAARIRRVRRPEPYRGKGIRYVGEQVRRKVGKAGSK